MPRLDPRLTPARPDLAAEHLRDQVEALQFVAGTRMRVTEEVIDLRSRPNPEASVDTQALYGEEVMVYEDHEGWAWGQLLADEYVGYMPANALRAPGAAATHRVSVPRSFAYPGASMKLPVVTALPLGARVSIVETQGDFSRSADNGFIVTRHLAAIADFAPDFVSIAEMFLSVPYLWGGKTSLGLDCSGLIQIALAAAGVAMPRDSDMLQAAFGAAIDIGDDFSGLQRGDLVFWKGHCGIMRDAQILLHANGHHMMVASEPLRGAANRILAKSYGPVTGVRRMR